jgi:hypothetical protein
MDVCRGHRRLAGTSLAAALIPLVLASCTVAAEEPGLFGREPSTPSAVESVGSTASADTGWPAPGTIDVDLPVLGERTWFSAGEQSLPFRIAVHGLRRIRGGTVLDWSLTPLAQVGHRPGEVIPADDLGAALDPTTFRLIDPYTGQAHRPLIRNGTGECLCRQRSPLRIGVTQILQVTFGELPADLPRPIMVDIPIVEPFIGLPVGKLGEIARTIRSTELPRAPEVRDVVAWSPTFAYLRPGGQQLRIGIVDVLSTTDSSTVVWTIASVSGGAGLDQVGGTPVTAPADRLQGRSSASAPQLRVTSTDPAYTGAEPLTVWRIGPKDVCACTELGSWSSGLTQPLRSVTVITNLPPLPIYTDRVDVILPGLPVMPDIEVHRPVGAGSYFGGFITDRSDRWEKGDPQPSALPIGDWPTPLPGRELIKDFRPTVQELN